MAVEKLLTLLLLGRDLRAVLQLPNAPFFFRRSSALYPAIDTRLSTRSSAHVSQAAVVLFTKRHVVSRFRCSLAWVGDHMHRNVVLAPQQSLDQRSPPRTPKANHKQATCATSEESLVATLHVLLSTDFCPTSPAHQTPASSEKVSLTPLPDRLTMPVAAVTGAALLKAVADVFLSVQIVDLLDTR